jgi:hypothetical protein
MGRIQVNQLFNATHPRWHCGWMGKCKLPASNIDSSRDINP